VILMRAGRIEQNGAPAELYQRPESVFAARFIGAPPMNVFAASALAGSAELAAGAPAGRDLGSLVMGVRPESLRLCATGLPAKVVAAEYLGADTQVETRLGADTVMVRTPGRCAVTPGETVHLSFTPAEAHWFDASSQHRID
jgi:sn-glycerol 3-phosphate transport system ATP-binding protein